MSFNLSAWALQNRQIVLYLMILLGAVGALSYSKLGQSEDPPFTFKAMVVQTNWPGASAEEVARQVTERIEKKLMETGDYDRIVSFSRPGVSQVTFMAREDIHSSEIPELWYQIRKKISDIRATLPQSIQGPFFNDEFGTTYGNIYALTGKGFDYAVMKDYADRLQLQLQRIRNVGKVELIGLQDEKIWIDLSNTKLATLGLPLAAVQKALEEQNAVASSGFFETASDRVQLRVSGRFDSVEEIRDFPIRVGDRTFRIGDVAEVRRGFNDPPAPRMRFMGEDAIGLAVAMKPGGDILVLGKALETEFARLQQSLPAGLIFTAIISTAMIASSTSNPSAAFPMLTGTLITAAGFLPIATAQSGTGEYTRSLFQVVTIALVVSWFAAVVFVPYLGAKLLPDLARLHAQKHGGSADGYDPYATAFYQRFRRLVEWCVRYRKTVIVLTLAAFVGALLLFRLVPQQFFPPSARLELLLDIKLAEGASLRSTGEEVQRLEKMLQGHDGIDNYVAYVGTGSPRFYLPLDQQLPAASFAQVVVLAKDLESREALRKWLIERMNEDFPHLRSRISRLENGPPVGYPVQFRVSGEDIPQVRELARKVADKMRENPHVVNVHLDWEEPSKVVYLSIDQERARALGVSTASLSQFLQSALTGSHVSFFREDNELIEILLRGTEQERRDLSLLPSLAVPTENGRSVALSQIATLEYGFEEGIIWHRNRLPTVTVRADIYDDSLPATLVAQIAPTLEPIRAELPDGYLLEVGGTVEDAAKGQSSVNAGVPLFIVVVLSLLMVQLRSFSRMAMVFLTAPLGLIGVTLFLLLFRQPFGFVAMLGTIALAGMIMRNSVILVDQIEQDISHGLDRWHAIIEATVRRFRPIVLTALAAVLAMIPLSRSVFFGPMAVAIMGGLIVATVLTLLFLPALYAAWFRVKKDEARA
ncbi:efflux RND transporter permease subunit [Pseudomonas aeruginosa]|uniref:efflux RND transporter permease subunit n=1 Tax=Pseudomonas aeruginosa TaxID=287 RepID=UPI0010504DD6|nr:efflux RND transporter permease subunit [Pseudomonas aeruginosa]